MLVKNSSNFPHMALTILNYFFRQRILFPESPAEKGVTLRLEVAGKKILLSAPFLGSTEIEH